MRGAREERGGGVRGRAGKENGGVMERWGKAEEEAGKAGQGRRGKGWDRKGSWWRRVRVAGESSVSLLQCCMTRGMPSAPGSASS